MSRSSSLRMPRIAAVAAASLLATVALAGPAQAAPNPDLPAPSELRLEPASPTQATSITARWTAPEGVPADATAHWALCRDADVAPPPGEPNGCGDANRPSDTRTATTISVPDEFSGTLWVWFEDAEGDEGPPARVPVVVDRTAPDAPTGLRWTTGAVSWTPVADGGAPVVRAHWRLCRSWLGFPADCIEGASDAGSSFAFAEGPLPTTPRPRECIGYMALLTVWLEDAAGNVDRRRQGGTGIGATPACPPDPPKGTPESPRTATSLSLAHRVRSTGKGAKRRQRLTVTANATPAAADGSVKLRVTAKHGKRKLLRTRTVRLADGRASFTVTVPKGFRRLSVKATYAGSKTHLPASRTTTVRIPRR